MLGGGRADGKVPKGTKEALLPSLPGLKRMAGRRHPSAEAPGYSQNMFPQPLGGMHASLFVVSVALVVFFGGEFVFA